MGSSLFSTTACSAQSPTVAPHFQPAAAGRHVAPQTAVAGRSIEEDPAASGVTAAPQRAPTLLKLEECGDECRHEARPTRPNRDDGAGGTICVARATEKLQERSVRAGRSFDKCSHTVSEHAEIRKVTLLNRSFRGDRQLLYTEVLDGRGCSREMVVSRVVPKAAVTM